MSGSPADGSPRTIALRTGPATYLESGEGPPVVCIHGLPGSSRDFRWLFEPVAARARLVAIDLPGFGQTPVATAPDASPEGRAAFVLELVDALGLESPLLVGHSMGGVVAVAAVAQRPGGFRGLGLLASPGLRPHAAYRRIPRRALHAIATGPWAPLFTPIVRRLFATAGFRGYPDAALVRTVVCLRHTSLEAHAERLKALALPTLAAWCEDDAIIEPPILAELAKALPPGPRRVWPTGGHVPQKTHPAEFAEALVELIEHVERERPSRHDARQPYLEGPHVRLRPLREADFEALYEVARDPLLWEQHPCPDRWEEPVFRAYFDEALACGGALVIEDSASGRALGASQFRWLDESKGELEIGWTFLARARWGGATNGEVKRLMVGHALRFATRVVFFVGLDNLRSQRALEKIGAARVGLAKNRAGRDSVRFEFTAAAWTTTP